MLFCLLGLTLAITACNQSTASGSASSTVQGDSGYAAFTYEDVDFKIVSVAQQGSFDGDSVTGASSVVRFVLKESNKADTDIYISYSNTFLLILPDSDAVFASAEETSSIIKRGTVRDNWIDFPLNDQQDLSKLVLRVGVTGEHQMDIPLAEHPNLNSYQPKTIMLGHTIQYDGVNWTVTKVTASLSADGKQAAAGMRYITVELSVDNPGSSIFYPQPDNMIRLESSGICKIPEDSTLPSGIVADSKGATGIVYFLMPENDTQLTLDFLAQPYSGIQAISTNFQIPVQQ